MNSKLFICSAIVGLVSTSCMDDNYDLSDIDTTSRIAVNDLVIPVNFSEVHLSDIISLDENSDIKIVKIDGVDYYAVTRSGDFDSKSITIQAPVAKAPDLESKNATLYSVGGVYTIPEMGDDFTFSCSDVDKSIAEIRIVEVSGLDFTIQFNTPSLSAGTYENVRLRLPKGMKGSATAGTYDAGSGVWTIPSLPVSAAGIAKATFTSKGIDFTANEFSYSNPKFEFTSNFSILGAELKAEGTTVEFSVDFTLSELDVTSFSGKISYEIEGMDIAPINLGDLPKFLQGEETNIALANPLICLNTTNPVAGDKLSFSAGLTLTANRDGETSKSFTSEDFTVGYGSANGFYNTVLSPEKPSYVPEKFEGFDWFAFPGLGSLLAGNGLPASLDVYVNNPRIPEQPVDNFVLGRKLDGVIGSYELFAPLALESGSTIVYTDIKDGWNEDIEDMVINVLTLTATATNNTPLDATLTIYPLGVDGKRLSGVELTSSELKSGEPNLPLTFTLKGEIKNLDGIEIVAIVKSASSLTLSPDQTIDLKDIRVKVNGYYQKEF